MDVLGRQQLKCTWSTARSMVLAHEIGHVLLNPLGIDDSDNPDHLMYHPERHPEEATGSRDGLLPSDCLGAHARVLEHDGAWASTGRPWAPSSESCVMRPRLGNNLFIVQEMQT